MSCLVDALGGLLCSEGDGIWVGLEERRGGGDTGMGVGEGGKTAVEMSCMRE